MHVLIPTYKYVVINWEARVGELAMYFYPSCSLCYGAGRSRNQQLSGAMVGSLWAIYMQV